MDKNKIADVLEDAARLYKDEVVDWCVGAWVQPSEEDDEGHENWDEDLGLDSPGLKLTVCAEGALLRACGLSWQDVHRFGNYSPMEQRADPRGRLFQEARQELSIRLAEEVGKTRVNLYSWNDNKLAASADPKGDLIDRFEATAKELRNG